MNASSETAVMRRTFTGHGVGVMGCLPFQLEVVAESGWVTGAMALHHFAPLANFLVRDVLRYVRQNGTSPGCDILLQKMAEAQTIKCELRDVARGRINTPSHKWTSDDEDSLVFDKGPREVWFTRFAEDHFAAIHLVGHSDVWIARLVDDTDGE